MAVSQVETLAASTVKTISVRSNAGASWNMQELGFNIYVAETKHIHNRFASVEVMNVDGVDAIYFRLDGVNPTVAGDDCYVLAALAGDSVLVPVGLTESIDVKAISAGTPVVSVRGA